MRKILILTLSIVFLSSFSPAADSPKISADLKEKLAAGNKDEELQVIIQYNDAPAAADFDRIKEKGGKIKRGFNAVRGIAASLSLKEIEELQSDSRIRSISPDRIIRGSMDIADPASGANLVYSNLGYTGKGVTVALIDSGLQPGSSIQPDRILAYMDMINESSVSPGDEFGHGTHIAGIIGGSNRTETYHGIAPDVKFVVLRVLDGAGTGRVSNVIEAVDWVIDNAKLYGIRVINLSLGHPVYESYLTDPLTQACEKAWMAGISVITSAGNRGRTGNGYWTINSPGNDPYIITVGAMNDFNTIIRADDNITTYSSRGPSLGDRVLKPDLVAPGNRIVSTLAKSSYVEVNFAANVKDQDHIELSGTSMATGVVTGAVSLMLQRNPLLSPDQIKALLMASADKLENIDVFARGAGYLNVPRAILMIGPYKPVRFNSASPIVIKTEDSFKLISPPSVYVAQALWGDQAL
ncbi:MAG: S8 family peptidase, partial [Acidobacteriota bacterium]